MQRSQGSQSEDMLCRLIEEVPMNVGVLRLTEISEEMMVRVMFKCVSVLLLCHCTLQVSSINRLVSTAK